VNGLSGQVLSPYAECVIERGKNNGKAITTKERWESIDAICFVPGCTRTTLFAAG
jgi:hypothetical protein